MKNMMSLESIKNRKHLHTFYVEFDDTQKQKNIKILFFYLTYACMCINVYMETQKTILQTEIVEELVKVFDSKFFKTLSEPVRVQILKFLPLNGRADIGTIAEFMPQDRSMISRHLHLMYEAGILTGEKENRHIYYAMNVQTFLEKVKGIADKLRAWMLACCPDCCRKT